MMSPYCSVNRVRNIAHSLASPSRQGAARPPGVLLPSEAERRRLTVLFCNFVDSTTLAGCLDPENFREVVWAYHQTWTQVIQR
jgi:class 3 adenylate cyclase